MQGQLKLLGITCIFCAYFGSAPIADPVPVLSLDPYRSCRVLRPTVAMRKL